MDDAIMQHWTPQLQGVVKIWYPLECWAVVHGGMLLAPRWTDVVKAGEYLQDVIDDKREPEYR